MQEALKKSTGFGYHCFGGCGGADADVFQHLSAEPDLQHSGTGLSVLSFKKHFHAGGSAAFGRFSGVASGEQSVPLPD